MRAPHLLCSLLLAACLGPNASAAVYTVGPAGSHSSLHAALMAASAAPGTHEIRIASGTLAGNAWITLSLAQEIVISGGWNESFAERSNDPAATRLEGVGDDALLAISGNGGRVEIENLSLSHASSTYQSGACAALSSHGSLTIVLRDSIVSGCVTTSEWHCSGVAINAYARDSGRVELLRNRIVDNHCLSLPPSGFPEGPGRGGTGAGIAAGAQDSASLLLSDNYIADNTLWVDGGKGAGAGLWLLVQHDAQAEVHGNRIIGNRVAGETRGGNITFSDGVGAVLLAGWFPETIGAPRIEARANVVSGNRLEADLVSGAQLYASAGPGGILSLGDSEISSGLGSAFGLEAISEAADAVTQLTNLTIVGHAVPGLRMQRFDGGSLSLHNSLLAANQGAPVLPELVDVGSNLIADASGGPDPRFVNAPAGNYRLRADSPARDAGGALPPAGLGMQDADGGLRIVGPAVDIGAFEFGAHLLFASGFEEP